MKITFEMENEQKVLIKSNGKVIGHIFTPSSSGNSITNAIQICGFETAFDLWGCALFGKKGVNDKFFSKKDIQLLFHDYVNEANLSERRKGIDNCWRCYSFPCVCETEKGDPFTVKREKELCERGLLGYKDGKPFWHEEEGNIMKVNRVEKT